MRRRSTKISTANSASDHSTRCARTCSAGTAFSTSPYLLERDSQALAQCAAIADLQSRAKALAAARGQRTKAMADALNAASLPAKAKEGIGIMAGIGQVDATDPLLANRLAMAGATAELCELLAKRGWFNNGGYFGFRSGADEVRFRALSKRRMELAGEAERIDRAAQARMATGRDMVREMLSKSIFGGS
jgi:hypothetical protein